MSRQWYSAATTLALLGCFALPVHAEIGIVVYGSKGVDARRTDSGHVALIVTDLCARGIDQVRLCSHDEPQGVVITKYPDLASGYDKTIFVAPLIAHFGAVDDPQSIPVLSSASTLYALQIQYWRDHLKPYLPTLSQAQYREMTRKQSEFNAGRTIRRLLTMEFLAKLLAGHPDQYSINSIAMTEPQSADLIPNGRWREAIGVEHLRSSVIITVPATLRDELQLAPVIDRLQRDPFNVLTNNCSDFTKQGLKAVLGDHGLHIRPRALDPADAWITSPLLVTTGLVQYAKKHALPLHVLWMPMLASTRRPSFSVKPISRGALVPDPNQGKIAFGLKVYVNTLNPLIGATALGVSYASGFARLEKLIYERDGDALSPSGVDLTVDSGRTVSQRNARAVHLFGTPTCWQKKEQQFSRLAVEASETGSLTKAELSLMLLPDRPFLLPRFYERVSALQSQKASLMLGVRDCLHFGCTGGLAQEFLPLAPVTVPVPGRTGIRAMTQSDDSADRAIAFRLMMSVINYDLMSEPRYRQTSAGFDQDWQLLLSTATAEDLRLPLAEQIREGMAECSDKQFAAGRASTDAVRKSMSPVSQMLVWMRRVVYSPVR